MRYMMLICDNGAWERLSEDESRALYGRIGELVGRAPTGRPDRRGPPAPAARHGNHRPPCAGRQRDRHRRALPRGEGGGGRLRDHRRRGPGRRDRPGERLAWPRYHRDPAGRRAGSNVGGFLAQGSRRREVDARLGATVREERGRLVAALVRILGDWDVAEELVQEALVAALQTWPRDGLPERPGAWLLTVARRRALDRLRRDARYRDRLARIGDELQLMGTRADETGGPMGSDDRLRLLFTCCHPALSLEAQVALTLRTVAGMETPAVARAFLVPGGDGRAAHRAGQAEDPRRGDPVPGTGAGRTPRPPRRRPVRPVPRVQRGLPRLERRGARAPRAVHGRRMARLAARTPDARRAGGSWPPRPHAPAPGPS